MKPVDAAETSPTLAMPARRPKPGAVGCSLTFSLQRRRGGARLIVTRRCRTVRGLDVE
ncbi:hypothetical protein [Roseitranquillus sediminis]|uniref:hypothetical protein n=1 Tax=Roseitranquillus sediminis TaxID=2809051 RepID=UPI001D0C3F4B|nr:hypothetical protein [Roseitranquillus sediminis]MBM9594413.1 hypothetical protein [Roseitranquillus sediminis]